MKIMVCETCGKLIHRDERCCHCGGTGMYPAEYEFTVPEAAVQTYGEMNELLAHRDFAKVLALSEKAMEWMSFTGEIYWLRLLAKRECATDRELLIRGADLEHSGEYFNAIKYAGAEEHQVYMDIREKMDALKQQLIRVMRQYYREEKDALKLMETSRELEEEILKTQNVVADVWKDLNDAQMRIRSLEADCRMALTPHLRTLQKAHATSDTVRQQVNQLNACSEEEFRSFQLRMAAALQLSEESAQQIRKMTGEHPWKSEYERLKEEQERCVSQINVALEDLGKITARAEALAEELEELEGEQQMVFDSIEAGDFREARELLTETEFNGALAAAGIAV